MSNFIKLNVCLSTEDLIPEYHPWYINVDQIAMYGGYEVRMSSGKILRLDDESCKKLRDLLAPK